MTADVIARSETTKQSHEIATPFGLAMTNQRMEVLKEKLKGKVVIVGIGNSLRGDDGAGPELIKKLKVKSLKFKVRSSEKNHELSTPNHQLCLIDTGSVPENFLQKIVGERPDVILLVDTINLGKPAGSVEIIKAENLKEESFSTHNASLKLTIAYLKKETKASVFLLGIQPKNIGFGQKISPEVEESVKKIAKEIEEIVHH